MRRALVIEIIVIGLICVLLSILISGMLTGKFLYERNMLVGSFLMGAIMHFSFEILGLNEWWCVATYK